MRPRKKWEPQYHFGGAPWGWKPAPLGTTHGLVIKSKPKKGKRK